MDSPAGLLYMFEDEDDFPTREASLDSTEWHNSDCGDGEMDDLDAVFSFYSEPASPMLSKRATSGDDTPLADQAQAAASPREELPLADPRKVPPIRIPGMPRRPSFHNQFTMPGSDYSDGGPHCVFTRKRKLVTFNLPEFSGVRATHCSAGDCRYVHSTTQPKLKSCLFCEKAYHERCMEPWSSQPRREPWACGRCMTDKGSPAETRARSDSYAARNVRQRVE